ncbi:2-C-methyl-D-erythritol 4-phosphate cytidylyltransferase [Alteromonas sp. 345S023]|jgi:2-C-methyl-D-erythritol 4-phosphate cytidylyltransferase|uniref:2-C-methyl-D-erythritol 4-phosphate cytidylyltransferase n=1 Tax=Alteromonas profundi TaxID=2696062 RepID=A0A7X5LMP1_9ALTE|nr:2-C-methyl-D-erythritol 4-phosphate cytidylyltransferase [Alteromonas profundi]NDV91465.1 2-C-methyl-D-erythritol 4-phosphate cytidylyltransferase [Alteromonas profundi]
MTSPLVVAVIPAAGIGNRMQADRPKQYLSLAGKTILEHTVELLLSHPKIHSIVIAISAKDTYIHSLSIATHEKVTLVEGGAERADSVLSALSKVPKECWALVHDAARPCVAINDIDNLLSVMRDESVAGGILATPVRDTMKRASSKSDQPLISYTESREALWHALTPQLFPSTLLINALNRALQDGANVTDEASAIEHVGGKVALISGNPANIKITHPADLPLAEFYLQQRDKAQLLCE